MPWGAWGSLHGGSRKWFPEQHRKSRQPGIGRSARHHVDVDPSFEKRVGAWRLDIGVAPGCMAGTPVIAVGLEWFCPNCDAPNCYLHWHVTESGYRYCPVGHSESLDPHWS